MSTTQQEVKALKKDIVQLKEMLAEHAEKPSNGSTHISREDLRELANQAGRNVRTFVRGKRRQVKDVTERAEHGIQEHPFRSTAIAFAGGLVLASLLGRK